ncbi:tRNA threonylcarbamoyladenosine biosynthesis protein TsaE [Fusobacterium naviforme]|uniref:tRNA threonylcarbamoyladenosine biosynthesis protein TsaE n=1 Tax=Moryella indoligenes TaxID=371674 RepID=A0AAE3V833_9FIRM|nr:tRNA (adenosine(37)-N6)-threonylcarbamoyltransferase complex ATPase subunit type 1 TsaE [Moryella indoligenes]KAB0576834.1 tRNA (adenosine(37)-N6)-threonylcarbamoyltransferase complex ATPase subunit type 1 TsaE [Fusobacterium naviforme]MDQ0151335.1 tRNA threonylcarbamoyladenosine biosynthesis protein TsaE [Moryella indoligenes]PSL09854.1 tRNA threonylcarbamoyladenosine biosynthesis protein TsaE [Fusobacterium naviforme]STO27817.1 ADP-binding protein [Fusobacterium naviforme]
MTAETHSDEETERFAAKLAERTEPGTVICLDGELGTGKTVFARGFARGLGITEPIVSPTFTILHGYEGGRLPLWHFDVYRIEDPDEMYEIGFEDCFYGEGVSLVEWASLISELIPKDAVHVILEKDAARGFDYRKITVEGLDFSPFGREMSQG